RRRHTGLSRDESSDVSSSDLTCAEPTGTITITSPLGANLEYSIDGVNYQSGVVFSGLGAGTYQVTVRDINDTTCVSDATEVTINAAPDVPEVPEVTVTQPTCAEPTGTITITSPLGANLEYSIDGVNYQSGVVFSGLGAGTYQVTVRDINDTTCVSEATEVIINDVPTGPDAPVSKGDLNECATNPIQTLDANNVISVGPDEFVVWFDAPLGGNVVDNPILNNIGTVTYWAEAVSNSDPSCVSSDRTSVTLTLSNCSIALVKEGELINSGDCTVVGDSIIYTFSVYNTGDAPISNVFITDPLFEDPNPIESIDFVGGDTNSDGNLDVDEIWVYTANYSITQSDLDLGEVINQAFVSGVVFDSIDVSDISGTLIENDNPTIVELCQDMGIALEKTGVFDDNNGDGAAQVGETITYSFTVYNTGSLTLYNITINDPLVNVEGGPIVMLAPGESDSTTFTAVYVITQGDLDEGEVVNQATVTAEDINGNI